MHYFDDESKRASLYQELEEWLDTPYKHCCMVKGRGVDCIHLAIGVFYNIGVFKKLPPVPEYSRDWHLHNTRSLIYEAIEKYLKVDKIEKGSKCMDGDIFVYQFGKTGSHSAIYCKGSVYHSVTNLRVTKSDVYEANWYSKLIGIFRIRS